MKFFYLSFNDYRKLDSKIKSNFLFLSTAYTTPQYWDGQQFKDFVPSKQLFQDACINFEKSQFEQRYKNQINLLDRNKIIQKLKMLTNKDIVFLVWEADNKGSQRDIFIPWITNTSIKDIKSFSFNQYQKTLSNGNLFQI